MNDSRRSAVVALRHYAAVTRRQWWLVLIALVLAIGAAVAYVELKTPTYGSSMKLVVGQGRTLVGADVSSSAQPLTQTMTSLLESDVVSRTVVRDLGLRTTAQHITDNLEVSARPDTAVLEVEYHDTDRARSTRVLRYIGVVFTRLVSREFGEGSGTQAPRSAQARATVFDPAHALPGKVWPRTKLTLAVAALLGLLTGFGMAFLRDALQNRIRNEEEAEDAFGAQVIGALPRGTLGTKPENEKHLRPTLSARLSESRQLLGSSIRFASGSREKGVVVVTSPSAEDGKTTLVSQLGATLASAARTVVLVEADLRRPGLSRHFGVLSGHRGLSDLMAGDATLGEVLIDAHPGLPPRPAGPVGADAASARGATTARPTQVGVSERGSLLLLSAGRKRVNPDRVLSLDNMARLIGQLKVRADYVIFDTPPLLLCGDAFPLAQLSNTVVVACREGVTTRDQADSVRHTMASLEVRDFLVVLTESRAAEKRAYGYEYDDAGNA